MSRLDRFRRTAHQGVPAVELFRLGTSKPVRGSNLRDVVLDARGRPCGSSSRPLRALADGHVRVLTACLDDGSAAALDLTAGFGTLEVAEGYGSLAVTAESVVVSVRVGDSAFTKLTARGTACVAARFALADLDWIALEHRQGRVSAALKDRTISLVSAVPVGTIRFDITDVLDPESATVVTKSRSGRALAEVITAAACDVLDTGPDLPPGTPRFGDPNPDTAALRAGRWEHDAEAGELVVQLRGGFPAPAAEARPASPPAGERLVIGLDDLEG